jgi:hypothetical protein
VLHTKVVYPDVTSSQVLMRLDTARNRLLGVTMVFTVFNFFGEFESVAALEKELSSRHKEQRSYHVIPSGSYLRIISRLSGKADW